MPILADALQDAGCEDDVILDHLRSYDHSHLRGCAGGCWYGTCWVIQAILDKEQMVRAIYEDRSGDIELVQAINPGDEFGRAYIVHALCGHFSIAFCVEAYYESDAIDVFIDSEAGEGFRISEEDLKDYGTPTDLEDGPWIEYDCYFTDGNHAYDPHALRITRLHDAKYVCPGAPLNGIDADRYNENYRNFCEVCQRQFYQLPELPDFFCSKECLALHESKYDYLDDP